MRAFNARGNEWKSQAKSLSHAEANFSTTKSCKHPFGLTGRTLREEITPAWLQRHSMKTYQAFIATTVKLAFVKIACNVTIFCGQAQVLNRGFTVYTVALGGKQEYNRLQRGLSCANEPTECGLTHVGLHPMIRIAQLPHRQLLSTSPVLSGIPLRVGFTRVVKTLKCNISIAYRVKQCWCG